MNPTFGLLHDISLEVNIFDFDDNIYDKMIDIDFIAYIRQEKHFHNIEELINQLNKDQKDIVQLLE